VDAKNPEPDDVRDATPRAVRTGPPPDEFANPAGVGGDVCDVPEDETDGEPCDPTEAEDLVLEESKPGFGIFGFEGEEVGGG
jgi:hypothetical protein